MLAWLTKIFVEDKIRLSPLLSGHRWRSVAVALAAAVPVAAAYATSLTRYLEQRLLHAVPLLAR